MANELLISAEGITKKFGSLIAVDDVNIDVYSGEICGVAGLNGAGKSTLLAILAGVMRPDSGVVYYKGIPVNAGRKGPANTGRRGPANAGNGDRADNAADSRARTGFKHARKGSSRVLCIGYVPQETALFPDLTVYDNLKFWALANPNETETSGETRVTERKKPLKDRILAVTDATGLSGKMSSPVHSLSGGMKQRVNISAALVSEPDILIMDEPTAGLDVKNRRDIINIINTLVRSATGRLAVICTSHQPGELDMISDRLLLLDGGKVVFNGPPKNIFNGKYALYENIDDILYSLSGGA